MTKSKDLTEVRILGFFVAIVRICLSFIVRLQIFQWISRVLLDPKSERIYIQSIMRQRPKSKGLPLVSVVIPIFDRTDELRQAIDSCLRQSYKNLEIILVLDGSPKRTRDVVNEYTDDSRIKVISFDESSGNAVRPRNSGIQSSSGKYIAFLDSDDVMFKHRIAKSVALLESGYDVVYGGWQAIMDGSRSVPNLRNNQIVYSTQVTFEKLLRECIPCQSTVCVRREVFGYTGLLKPSLQYREDHELWLRMAYFGAKFQVIPRKLVRLRLHSGNNELNYLQSDDKWFQQMLGTYMQIGPRLVEGV